MKKTAISSSSLEKKSRKSTPTLLNDGTICYTVAVRYPDEIINELRKLCYEEKLNNMTDAIFFCIEKHKNMGLLSKEVFEFSKKDVTALTIRFREKHYEYIHMVCKTKELKTFSNGIIHVLYESLNIRERL